MPWLQGPGHNCDALASFSSELRRKALIFYRACQKAELLPKMNLHDILILENMVLAKNLPGKL